MPGCELATKVSTASECDGGHCILL